jgi:hypothetical protein
VAIKIAYVFYVRGPIVIVIVPVLLQLAEPLHSFECLCLTLKDVSCALACCIGTTTTAAESIATAAKTATITNVELFILSSFEYPLLYYIYIKKNNTEFPLQIYIEL